MKPWLAFFLLFSVVAGARDWPGWRGPDRTDLSTETGLLKSWPEGGPEKLWTYDQAGIGYAGFSIVDGTLFTMGARDGATLLLALDAASGAEKWTLELDKLFDGMPKWGDGPRGSVTVNDGHVYALAGNGNLVCATTAGKETWRKSLTADFGGSVPKWGYAESPLVDGDRVFVTPGGKQGALLALDKKSGEKIWQSKDFQDPAHYSSIIAADHGGKRMLVQLVEKNFVGIDAADGTLLWRQEWPGRVAVIPTPIYHDGKVFVTSGYGVGCTRISIGANGKSITEDYRNKSMKNHHGGVILLDGHLYGYSDGVGWACLEWDTGDEVWSEKKALDKGAIAYADGRFYCQGEKSGDVVLIEASTRGWKETGRFTIDPQTKQRKPDGRIWTHPVVLNGRLYLRDQELVHCYNVKAN